MYVGYMYANKREFSIAQTCEKGTQSCWFRILFVRVGLGAWKSTLLSCPGAPDSDPEQDRP